MHRRNEQDSKRKSTHTEKNYAQAFGSISKLQPKPDALFMCRGRAEALNTNIQINKKNDYDSDEEEEETKTFDRTFTVKLSI